MSERHVNQAFSVRRPVAYDEWLAVRDERNALALEVRLQARRIEELQRIITAQREQLLVRGTAGIDAAQMQAIAEGGHHE